MKAPERHRPSTEVSPTRSALVLRARRTLRALESIRGLTPDENRNGPDVAAKLTEALKAYIRPGGATDGDPVLGSELLAVLLAAERRAGLPTFDE